MMMIKNNISMHNSKNQCVKVGITLPQIGEQATKENTLLIR
jgi:hypothetical protein